MRADEAKITAGFGRHGALWVKIKGGGGGGGGDKISVVVCLE